MKVDLTESTITLIETLVRKHYDSGGDADECIKALRNIGSEDVANEIESDEESEQFSNDRREESRGDYYPPEWDKD